MTDDLRVLDEFLDDAYVGQERLSAAELQHGPRAALSSRTPVVLMRLMDETAATVDAHRRHVSRWMGDPNATG